MKVSLHRSAPQVQEPVTEAPEYVYFFLAELNWNIGYRKTKKHNTNNITWYALLIV